MRARRSPFRRRLADVSRETFRAGRKIGRMTRAIRPILGADRRYGGLRPPFDVGERYVAYDHLRFFVPVVPDAEIPPTPP